MASDPNKSAMYVQRHYVRQFLRAYARPSMLDELIDVMDYDDADITTKEWLALVRAVRTELVG